MASLVSILIPLPFVISSLVQVSPFELGVIDQNDEVNESFSDNNPRIRIQSRYLSFLGVCSLTAATLVLVGFIGELTGQREGKTNGKLNKSEPILSIGTMRRIIGRILSIGLPFYAASKLGGERIAIVILTTLAAGLMTKNPNVEEVRRPEGFGKLIAARKWTAAALVLQCLADLLNLTNTSLPLQTISGYLALMISVLVLPWPFPTTHKTSTSINQALHGTSSRRNSVSNSWELLGAQFPRSPMISTARDTDLTVASGVLATIISFVVFVLSSQQTQTLTFGLLLGGSIVAIASVISLLFADSSVLAPGNSLVLATSLGSSLFIQEIIDSHPLLPILFQSILIAVSWLGVFFDTKHSHSHTHSHHSHNHSSEESVSRFTTILLKLTEDSPTIHSILIEKDSRRIMYFMWLVDPTLTEISDLLISLNFAFMLVQTFYGWVTGSLGLLSDSIHMFFDCAALFVGLIASVMSKWPPSLRFPYGYSKVDTLAAFGNGVLLLYVDQSNRLSN
jgi:solute carrier family 30 (zinc transporter), member 5/7